MEELNGIIARFLVCPFTRREIIVTPKNFKVLCPECKQYHLLPDGASHTMEWYKEHNMCEESW